MKRSLPSNFMRTKNSHGLNSKHKANKKDHLHLISKFSKGHFSQKIILKGLKLIL